MSSIVMGNCEIHFRLRFFFGPPRVPVNPCSRITPNRQYYLYHAKQTKTNLIKKQNLQVIKQSLSDDRSIDDHTAYSVRRTS